jgi:DNA-directed RNA polymerase subunit beta'
LENVVTEMGGESSSKTIETTLGRALFNETLPANYPFVNEEVKKSKLGEVINDLAERYSKVQVAATLDALKEAGFRWATRSGVTISFADVVAPAAKAGLLAEAEEKADKIQKQYDRGLIADSERRQELIEVWTDTTNKVAEAMQENFPTTNPVWMMVNSGARGNMLQIRQIAGMRGLVANPKGEIIPRPIKSNFREGLSVLEYFISTHGARKGLADTALRTADSGYLTRRLVDVSQDVIIREEDCGTDRGITKVIRKADGSAEDFLDTTIASRCLAEEVVAGGKTLFEAGQDIGILDIDAMVAAGVDEIKVRSVLT